MFKSNFRLKRKWTRRIAIAVLLSPFLFFVLVPIPDPLFHPDYSTTVESNDGELLNATIASDGQWRFPLSDSLSIKFEKSILFFEDEYFYQHLGVNPISILKAIKANWNAGRYVRGGSTITMQLARLAHGNQPRTIWQKLIETVIAIKLELILSKKEILNLYAAHAPFGGNVVGLEAASWRYYGRSPKQLSWGESAALAVLPNSPSLIFPGKNELLLKNKRDFLLRKLKDREVIDSMTMVLSMDESLPGRPRPLPQRAPHLMNRLINEGGLAQRNKTTLSLDLQSKVSAIARNYSNRLQANFIHNAAVLVVDIESGKTISYVGNVPSGEIHGEQVDIISSRRSTGSLLKPFLYAAALDDGLIAPQQLLGDYPMFYESFTPKNFDLKYRGAVHADEALTRSLNIPFVNLLGEYGFEKFHQKLQRIGMTSLDQEPSHYGLSMILGGAEATLWELVGMYCGLYRVYDNSFKRPLTKAYNAKDYFLNHYLKGVPKKRQPSYDEISIGASWKTIQTLTGLNRPEGFAGWEQFQSSQKIAWKTGTSFGFRDAWAIGLNGKYAVGVWVGNADGEGRPGLVGAAAAAPLMFQVFDLLDGKLRTDPPIMETQQFNICTKSGQRSGPFCNDIKNVELPQTVGASGICSYHQKIHLDQTGKFRVTSICYAPNEMVEQNWFVLPPRQAWYYRQYNADYKPLPNFMPECKMEDDSEAMEFIYPRKTTKIFIPKELDGNIGRTVFEVAHRDSKETVFWHLDGQYLGSTIRSHQMGFFAKEGEHVMQLIDGQGNELNLGFEVLSK